MNRFRSMFGGRVWAAIVCGSLIGVLVFAIVMVWRGGRGETIVLQVQAVDDPNIVRVYVGGEVAEPGLYSLPRGSRVAEAIEAAGGETAVGDIAGFGMAAVINDADQIIVPARRVFATPASILPVSGASGVATAEPPVFGSSVINVNTAAATELEALPGVGPAIAARIIEYRELNGPFRSIHELEAVRGISERMVNEMRDLITVGP
ncbi:MAG TPA: ComEA family DNA-binding protein [Thermomicrobiales bacterium]|nr:ComEA family DNA-binding protein [Thermomicrobiales bacterium]